MNNVIAGTVYFVLKPIVYIATGTDWIGCYKIYIKQYISHKQIQLNFDYP